MKINELIEAKDIENLNKKELTMKALATILKRDCSDFLTKSGGNFLVRGDDTNTVKKKYLLNDKNNEQSIVLKCATHKDRQPRDVSIEKTELLNDYFKKKFGWNARTENTLFALGNTTESLDNIGGNEYADHIYLVFPKGQIKYIWSKHITDIVTKQDFLRPENISEQLKSYTDTNLRMAAKRDSEIMINCKEYYLVPLSKELELKEALK